MPAPKIPRLFVIVVMPLIDTQFPPLLPQRPIRHFITFPSFWHSRDPGPVVDIASCGASRDFTDLSVKTLIHATYSILFWSTPRSSPPGPSSLSDMDVSVVDSGGMRSSQSAGRSDRPVFIFRHWPWWRSKVWTHRWRGA